MARADDGYTRLVGWLKILLPLAALGLLSTVFLFSESNEATLEIPYSAIELDQDGLVERIVEPSFAGATDDGDLVSFVAASARPEGEGLGRIAASEFRGKLDLRAGSTITFDADTAIVDQPDGTARLQGNVVIVSSQGYRAETSALTADLRETMLESDDTITGQTPFGDFTAGRMVITGDAQGDHLQLVFTDGVNLVYQPKSD
ncbi:LPS export ABC transporter periplasmic protein LptC [Pseudooceanicola sp. MF1-13]|uniref:LPS export ABC transporter periplasmic protein LptC n=1 Tax=Pseudooceanicola sp. MF1-13 TaxID=3379095 RepID=UPI00389190D4